MPPAWSPQRVYEGMNFMLKIITVFPLHSILWKSLSHLMSSAKDTALAGWARQASALARRWSHLARPATEKLDHAKNQDD